MLLGEFVAIAIVGILRDALLGFTDGFSDLRQIAMAVVALVGNDAILIGLLSEV